MYTLVATYNLFDKVYEQQWINIEEEPMIHTESIYATNDAYFVVENDKGTVFLPLQNLLSLQISETQETDNENDK